MVVDLAPEVEERAGRTLVARPDSGILTREMAVQMLAKPGPRLMEGGPVVEPDLVRIQAKLQNMIAVYIPSAEGIYLIKETFEETFADLQLAPEALAPIVRCAVRHELVHALQHQYSLRPLSGGKESARGYSALMEGHATLIGQELCREHEGESIATAMDAAMMADVPSSVTAGDPVAEYAWGRLLADQLRGLGNEALWSALAGDSPEWGTVVKTVKPLLSPGWDRAEILRPLSSELVFDRRGKGSPVSATLVLSRLLSNNTLAVVALPETDAGLMWVSKSNAGHQAYAAAFLFRDAGSAREAIIGRRRAAKTRNAKDLRMLLSIQRDQMFELIPRPLRRLEKRDDVVDALWLQLDNGASDYREYNEYWVATEHVLLLGVSNNYAAKTKDVERQMGLRLDALEHTPVPRPAPQRPTWLSTDAVPDAGPSWQYRIQHAATLRRAGKDDPCGKAFGDVLTSEAAPSDGMTAAAFVCAVATDDIDTMQTLIDDVVEHEPEIALMGVFHLIYAGRATKALAIIDDVESEDRELLRIATDLRFRAWAELERWHELEAVAQSDETSLEDRYNGAVYLHAAGRKGPAQEVLAEICPELADQDLDLCALP